MIKNIRNIFLLVFLLSVNFQIQAQDNIIDQIIWVVGDEAILKSEVERARMEMQARGERIEGDPNCIIPEQLAIQKLYLDQAKTDSVDAPAADIARNLNHYEREIVANAGSKEKVEEYLGTPLPQLREEWREMIRNNYLVQGAKKKIIGKKSQLTPSEVRKYYNQLPKDSLPYIPTTVELQIITNEPSIPLAEIDKVKERLREFTRRINSGEASFTTLAVLYSDDKGSATNGGELGFMGRAQLVPEFSSVGFSLSDPTKISNIVQTEYGYHIIQLIERRSDVANFRHILLKPKVSQDDLNKASNRLDSIANDIKANKFTFEEATLLSADKDTRKSEGLMVNKSESSNYGTPRFTYEELPKEIAQAVEKMKVGEISKPFKMLLKNGNEGVAIIKLKNRIEGHVANVSDDYQALKEIVEQRKEQDILKKWMQNKIKSTYVRIDSDWCNCEYQYPDWVKKK